MFGTWCVLSSVAKRTAEGYRHIKVTCSIHGGEFWRSYDNLKANKSGGCRECKIRRACKYTEVEQRIVKRFHQMMSRCYNSNDPNFHKYGGRGIQVEPHLQVREQYLRYVMSLPGADPELQIDREDNNRGYERGNLRWVTAAVNSRNKRTNIYVTWNNTEMVFEDFIRNHTYLSTHYARRLYRQGWSLQKLSDHRPALKGRRAQSVRLGKLRPNESIHGRAFPPTDSP